MGDEDNEEQQKKDRDTARKRKREREVGDWSYERVVMVTSDHDEVVNDQERLLERKCKYIQMIHNYIRHEMPIQDVMGTNSKVKFYS